MPVVIGGASRVPSAAGLIGKRVTFGAMNWGGLACTRLRDYGGWVIGVGRDNALIVEPQRVPTDESTPHVITLWLTLDDLGEVVVCPVPPQYRRSETLAAFPFFNQPPDDARRG